MNKSEPLRRLLENLGKSYARRPVNVAFSEQPRITEDGETIYVWSNPAEVLDLDISGANEFRLIRDALNHETAHDRFSVLTAKADFAARYRDDGHAQVAGTVLNILEDAYIDSRRLAEYPGLRHAHAFFSESQMSTDVSDRDVADGLVMSIHQIAQSGRVNGIRNADDDVREFAAWVRPHVEAVRRADNPDEREAIAARVTDELVSRLPSHPDLDDLLDELADMSELADENEVENAEPVEIDEDMIPDDLAELEPATDDEQADEGELTDEAAEKLDDMLDEQADEGTDDADADESEATSGEAEAEDDDEQAEQDAESGPSEDAGTGDEEQAEQTEQGEPSGQNEADESENRLGEELDELDELDERGESPEWHGVDESEDYESATESDERRYERVEDEAAFGDETDIGERMSERDSRAESVHSKGRDATSDGVRKVLRETGLGRDVRRAFEKFATNDRTVTSDAGDRMNLDRMVDHMSGDYGVTDVYETDYTAATGGRCIGVALDLSTSMKHDGSMTVNSLLAGRKGAIVDAKVALGAIHLAAHELGDDLVASGFSDSYGNVDTPLITGPGERFKWEHLDAVTYGGNTPTAHGVLDTLDLIKQNGGKDEIMLVLTDGLPKTAHPDLSGRTNREDAAIAVNMARAQGVGVIGVGVGSGVRENIMSDMFGADGYVLTDSENLVDELVNIYADELDYDRPA